MANNLNADQLQLLVTVSRPVGMNAELEDILQQIPPLRLVHVEKIPAILAIAVEILANPAQDPRRFQAQLEVISQNKLFQEEFWSWIQRKSGDIENFHVPREDERHHQQVPSNNSSNDSDGSVEEWGLDDTDGLSSSLNVIILFLRLSSINQLLCAGHDLSRVQRETLALCRSRRMVSTYKLRQILRPFTTPEEAFLALLSQFDSRTRKAFEIVSIEIGRCPRNCVFLPRAQPTVEVWVALPVQQDMNLHSYMQLQVHRETAAGNCSRCQNGTVVTTIASLPSGKFFVLGIRDPTGGTVALRNQLLEFQLEDLRLRLLAVIKQHRRRGNFYSIWIREGDYFNHRIGNQCNREDLPINLNDIRLLIFEETPLPAP